VNGGTDFLEIQAATDLNSFFVAVGQTITQVRESNPPARMRAVAKQIIDTDPTLVSLEELHEWYTSSFNPSMSACGQPKLEFGIASASGRPGSARGALYGSRRNPSSTCFP
jgi:hypothetical protein